MITRDGEWSQTVQTVFFDLFIYVKDKHMHAHVKTYCLF